jgi:hypothetical protein
MRGAPTSILRVTGFCSIFYLGANTVRANSKKLKDQQRAKDYAFKQQKKQARALVLYGAFDLKKNAWILNGSFKDEETYEIANRSSQQEINEQMKKFFEGIYEGAIPPVEEGLVLFDSYGRGAFQDPSWWR